MKGLKNNLRYWVINMEKQTLFIVALLIVISGLNSLLWGESSLEPIMEMLSSYLVMMIFIFTFTNAFNNVLIFFPLTISLGSDRKSSFIAMQLAQHLMVMEFLALFILVTWLQWGKEEKEVWGLMTMIALAAVFFLLGIGSSVGTVTAKSGRKAATILYLGLILLGGIVLGGIIGLAAGDIITVEFSWIMWLKPWILLLSVAFDAVMVVVFYRYIRKADLQFV